MAAILAVPAIGVFVYFYAVFDNILVGGVLAFVVHFVLLLKSDKISNFLTNLIDDKEKKADTHGFMSSDFFTFETDEENVMVLQEKNKIVINLRKIRNFQTKFLKDIENWQKRRDGKLSMPLNQHNNLLPTSLLLF